MTKVATFTFNPVQENTYIVYDETGECVIFDPGCYFPQEEQKLVDFIYENKLRPVRLINTHCHLDHACGNKFVVEKFDLGLEIHKDELPVLNNLVASASRFGLSVQPSPPPASFLDEKDTVEFGNTKLEILFTPGHSPASLTFYCAKDKFVIAGDVLFQNSIGRTDLHGDQDKNFKILINSIKTKLLPLPDDVIVYPGHGPATTIGYERRNNGFLR